MGHLLIRCGSCGSDWSVYHRDNWKDWKARTCPVCGESIDESTWNNSVMKGFGEMEDASIELVKDYEQYNGNMFMVGYVPDVVFPNANEIDSLKEEIEDLKNEVSNFRDIMTRFIDNLFTV